MTDMDRDGFCSEVVTHIPYLRAVARGLCGNPTAADDLVQEGLTRALGARERFTPGTNLKAWLYTILRNQFFSERRKTWRLRPLEPEEAEALVGQMGPAATLELDELRRALSMLAPESREALILVGAAELTYEEASEISGVPAGTLKSRVSRARVQLMKILDAGDMPPSLAAPSDAFAGIMRQIDDIKGRLDERMA